MISEGTDHRSAADRVAAGPSAVDRGVAAVGGRPRHFIGVDVGGTKILAVAVAADRPDVVVAHAETPTAVGAESVADAIVAVTRSVTDGCEGPQAVVPPLGIGMPGLVTRAGILRYGPNLPGVIDTDIVPLVVDRLGTRAPEVVAVDNDGNCAAWAEHTFGAGVGAADLVFIGLGTGISCGLVVEGRRIRGAHGFAGEPGHIIVERGGPRCACGRDGCWEALASGTALARIARTHAAAGRVPAVLASAGGHVEDVRGEHVTAVLRADPDDPGAVAVVAEFAAGVAVGLDAVVNLLDPSVVVLGGSVLSAADVLLDPIRAAYAVIALGGAYRSPLDLRAAQLGRRAGAVGAARLAAEAVGG